MSCWLTGPERVLRTLSIFFIGMLLMTSPGVTPDASGSMPAEEQLLTDFTPDSADMGWYVVNDNVMGGRSEGDFEQARGEIHFAGRTNTNGGGFSSIRTRSMNLDLAKYAGIRLRIKGDGRRYTWRLTSGARWRGREVSFWADFETEDDRWTTVDIPFSSFIPQFRGFRMDGFELKPEQITGMGLMIYDKLDGEFELRLASAHAYKESETN